MNIKTKVAGVALVLGLLVVPGVSLAQTMSAAALQAEIQSLNAELAVLQAKSPATPATTAGTGASLGSNSSASTAVSWCYTFTTTPAYGTSGVAVTALQTALKKDGESITITGTFDLQTQAAVIAFQNKYAAKILIPQGLTRGTGHVGVSTIAELNGLFACATPIPTPIKVPNPVPILSAPTFVTVTSPSAGQSFAYGSTMNIQWTPASAGVAEIQLVSTSGGVSPVVYSKIVSDDPIDYSGSYSFPVAGIATGSYYVRLLNPENDQIVAPNPPGTVIGQSGVFTITSNSAPAQTVTLLSPNGGEAWTFYQTQTVKWSATSGVGPLNFYLDPATSTVSSTSYLYSENVPSNESSLSLEGFAPTDLNSRTIPPGSYYFRITTQDGKVSARSAAPFTIKNPAVMPSITVTSPNGGETWVMGKTYNITWKSAGINTVFFDECGSSAPFGNVCQSLYGVTSTINPISGLPSTASAANGSYSYYVNPKDPLYPGNVKIEIVDSDSSAIYDESDNYFSVVPPAATSTTPSSTVLRVTQRSVLPSGTITPGSAFQPIGSYWVYAPSNEGVSFNTFTLNAGQNASEFQNLKLYVGASPFGSIQATVGNGGVYTFTGTPVTIPAGSYTEVDVYADVLSNAAGNTTNATTLTGCTATGLVSYATYTCNSASGQTMTVAPTTPTAYFSYFEISPSAVASNQLATVSFSGINLLEVHMTVTCPSGVSAPDGHGGNACGNTSEFDPVLSGINSTQLEFNNTTASNQQVSIVLTGYDMSDKPIAMTESGNITVAPAPTQPAPAVPTITSFTTNAPAPTINGGQNVLLAWSSQNAATCSMTLNGGNAVTVAPVGSESVTAMDAGAHTYALTCSNTAGKSSPSAVTINWIPASTAPAPSPTPAPVSNIPTITSFSISPASINLGQTVELAWSTTGATACTYTGSGTGVQLPLNFTNYGVTPTLAGTNTYVMTCTGPGGTSKSVSVSVQVANTATPPAVPQGMTATVVSSDDINLQWPTVANGRYALFQNGVQIANTAEDDLIQLAGGQGFRSASGLLPNTTYTFTLVSFNVAGDASAPSAPVTATTLPTAPTPGFVPTGPSPAGSKQTAIIEQSLLGALNQLLVLLKQL